MTGKQVIRSSICCTCWKEKKAYKNLQTSLVISKENWEYFKSFLKYCKLPSFSHLSSHLAPTEKLHHCIQHSFTWEAVKHTGTKRTCTIILLVHRLIQQPTAAPSNHVPVWAGGSRNTRSHLWPPAALKLLHYPDSWSSSKREGRARAPPEHCLCQPALHESPPLVCQVLPELSQPRWARPGFPCSTQCCGALCPSPAQSPHTSASVPEPALAACQGWGHTAPEAQPPQQLQGQVLLQLLRLNLGKSLWKFTSVSWNSYAKIMHFLLLYYLTCTCTHKSDSRISKLLSGGTSYQYIFYVTSPSLLEFILYFDMVLFQVFGLQLWKKEHNKPYT